MAEANTQKLDDLKFDPRNPRTISEHDFEALKKSLKTFGDLSCIIKNRTTGELVGGHQRVRALMSQGKGSVTIIEQFDEPNSVGTIALGYVQLAGSDERFKYREVVWAPEVQHSANIAANRITGEFNLDQLAELTYELQNFDPDLANLTGQTTQEINKLLAMVGQGPDIDLPDGEKEGFEQMTFTLSREQAEKVQAAISHVKQTKTFEGLENENSNGNALFFVAQEYLDQVNGLTDDQPSQTN